MVWRSRRQAPASGALATSSGGAPVAAATASITRSRMRRPPTSMRPLGRPPYRLAAPPARTAPRTLVAPPALPLEHDVEADREHQVMTVARGVRWVQRYLGRIGESRDVIEPGVDVAALEANLIARPQRHHDARGELGAQIAARGFVVGDDGEGIESAAVVDEGTVGFDRAAGARHEPTRETHVGRGRLVGGGAQNHPGAELHRAHRHAGARDVA